MIYPSVHGDREIQVYGVLWLQLFVCLTASFTMWLGVAQMSAMSGTVLSASPGRWLVGSRFWREPQRSDPS